MRSTSLLAAAVLPTVLSLSRGGVSSSPAAVPAPATTAATPAPNLGPPNAVLILADDMGWGDLGSYGNTAIKTPTLDRLAAEGARFTAFCVPAPICAPSRAGLLTGPFPGRTGIPWNPPDKLHDDEVVTAEVLKRRGYATGMVGKCASAGWPRTCRSTTAIPTCRTPPQPTSRAARPAAAAATRSSRWMRRWATS